jgi:hypothetical protein
LPASAVSEQEIRENEALPSFLRASSLVYLKITRSTGLGYFSSSARKNS